MPAARRPLLTAVLAAVLLFGNLLVLTHAHDADGAQARDTCATCLAGQVLQGAVPVADGNPLRPACSVTPAAPCPRRCPDPTPSAYLARAPPA